MFYRFFHLQATAGIEGYSTASGLESRLSNTSYSIKYYLIGLHVDAQKKHCHLTIHIFTACMFCKIFYLFFHLSALKEAQFYCDLRKVNFQYYKSKFRMWTWFRLVLVFSTFQHSTFIFITSKPIKCKTFQIIFSIMKPINAWLQEQTRQIYYV